MSAENEQNIVHVLGGRSSFVFFSETCTAVLTSVK